MSESFKAVIEDVANRAENAHDLAMDNPDSTTHCDAISAMLTDFVRRLVSAHDAEIKDLRSACEADGENCRIAIQSAQARFDELLAEKDAEIAEKDAEIARLKAALKPVLDHDTRNYGHARVQPSIVVAVRECQRIMREGGAK